MTVLVFAEGPVHFNALRKALQRVEGSPESLVCVARDFTLEARELATACGAQILSQRFSGCSDESHEKTKTLIRSRVKTPNWR